MVDFNANLQIYVVKKGNVGLCVNGENCVLKDGEICVIDSYEICERIEISEEGQIKIIQVPFAFLRDFNLRRQNRSIVGRIIKNKILCSDVYSLATSFLDGDRSQAVIKSTMDLILSLIGEHLAYGETKYGQESALVRKVLTYIHANFKGGATLRETALALGYTEAHVSRVFHKYLKTNITQYVNGLRYNAVKDELSNNSNKKILDAIYEAGFKSQQTYYRYKKSVEKE